MQWNRDKISAVNLLIATPFYEVKAYVPYMRSLIGSAYLLDQMGCKWDWVDFCGNPYVDHVKNAILSKFMAGSWTHLLMIDSDLSWDVEGFLRVVFAEPDFVGGTYPLKNNWNTMAIDNPEVPDSRGLVRCTFLPGGFLRFKRPCINRLFKAYDNLCYIDNITPGAHSRITINLFSMPIVNGERVSEDVEFCNKWKALGGEIWCEPRVAFSHVGTKEWSGRYSDNTNRSKLSEYISRISACLV